MTAGGGTIPAELFAAAGQRPNTPSCNWPECTEPAVAEVSLAPVGGTLTGGLAEPLCQRATEVELSLAWMKSSIRRAGYVLAVRGLKDSEQ